jgi:hypothetical protein
MLLLIVIFMRVDPLRSCPDILHNNADIVHERRKIATEIVSHLNIGQEQKNIATATRQ